MPDDLQKIELAVDRGFIETELRRLRSNPVPLTRPVVVLGGWRSPPFMASALARRLSGLTSGRREDFLCVSYPLAASVERAASIVRARLASWRPAPAGNPLDLDIVAISMGGLVARLLAAEATEHQPVLHIHRLFTFSTPHAGASLARWIRPDRAAAAMKPGSAFLSRLDSASVADSRWPTEITCYVQRLDWWIGTWNAAAPGRPLRWVHPHTLFNTALSHFSSHRHPTLLIDAARRLRGEPGLGEERRV